MPVALLSPPSFGLATNFSALPKLWPAFAEPAKPPPKRKSSTKVTPRGAKERPPSPGVPVVTTQRKRPRELAKLDEQITTLRRKHDELAHANMEKRRELEKLTDRLQDLSKEAQMPSAEDNQTMREIRALEARRLPAPYVPKLKSKHDDSGYKRFADEGDIGEEHWPATDTPKEVFAEFAEQWV